MSDEIARYYVEDEAATEVRFFPGVPLADVTVEQWEQQPEWVQASVDADPEPMYQETEPAV
jgi:hypothetical protein